jgi:lysophospholipid acyltransferase (LPLAT)-like uncharacterized protein
LKRWISRWLLPRVLGPLVGIVVRMYFLTIRIDDCQASQDFRLGHGPRGIFALWHAHQVAAIFHYRHLGAVTLASQHRDAEYAARAAKSLGYHVVRGSSTRGGVRAYMELADIAQAGRVIALTVDGPRGPRHEVKLGIIHLAKQSGAPVYPLAIGLSSFWELRSWDRFRIPKPFSRGYALWGKPVSVSADASEAEIESARLEIQNQLIALEPIADGMAKAVNH